MQRHPSSPHRLTKSALHHDGYEAQRARSSRVVKVKFQVGLAKGIHVGLRRLVTVPPQGGNILGLATELHNYSSLL
jgi:hypothetical protein